MATITTKPVLPCACCKTPGGYAPPRSPDCPVRRNGRPYGFEAGLCVRCELKHRTIAQRKARQATMRRFQATTLSSGTTAQARASHREAAILAAKVRRFLRIAAAAPSACDLCGQDPRGQRFSGAEFDLEGLICDGCRGELRAERAEARHRGLAGASYRHPDGYVQGTRPLCLTVLTPGFTRDDLTAKAAVALILAETRHVFRRAS